MADFGELFHLDIRTLNFSEIEELAKLLPSCARVNKGVGVSDTITALELVNRMINVKNPKKEKQLSNDWKAEETKKERVSNLEILKKEFEERKKQSKKLQKD